MTYQWTCVWTSARKGTYSSGVASAAQVESVYEGMQHHSARWEACAAVLRSLDDADRCELLSSQILIGLDIQHIQKIASLLYN